jgi:hypothetical protein
MKRKGYVSEQNSPKNQYKMHFKTPCFVTLRSCLGLLILSAAFVMFASQAALADTTATTILSQTINAGALAIDIVDSSNQSTASTTYTMNAVNFSFSSQAATGIYGNNNQRIYWENPDAADSGYTITMAATNGATACWDFSSGGSCGAGDYDFNDTSGATDGADADAYGGQLTVNPDDGTLAAVQGTTTGMTKGSSDLFEQGTTDSLTIVTAAAGADDITRTYITGVSLSQQIPASQAVGSYAIGMTLTIA